MISDHHDDGGGCYAPVPKSDAGSLVRPGRDALGETIAHVVLPASKSGIFTGIIPAAGGRWGEALAVAMVIGQMKSFPSLFLPASTLTTAISADMARHGKAANIMRRCGRWRWCCSCCRSSLSLLSIKSMPLPI